MSYRRRYALLALLISGCTRQPKNTETQRIAILRFENLGADPSTDWMGRAFPEILTAELSSASGIYAVPSSRIHAPQQSFGVRPIAAPGISSERTLALAAGANRIGYGQYAVRAGQVDVTLTFEDPAAGTTPQVFRAVAPDVIAAATDLAQQVSAASVPYGTANQPALKAWTQSLEADDRSQANAELEQAIAADPAFGPPYRTLAERKAQSGDRDGAIALLDRALAQGERMGPAERARIEFYAATLRGDAAHQKTALASLVKLAPRDTEAWQSLAQAAEAQRDYPAAVAAYREILELDPADAGAWNRLGYAAAYGRDFPAAEEAIGRYQKLRPLEADPVDSMGDVKLLAGRLPEAEEAYTQAAHKDPRFPASPELFKAAMARLMAGDVRAATAISEQYAGAREAAHDPLAEVYRAEWLWLTGQRKEAYEKLAAFADANPALSQRCYGELSMWSLLLGDRAKAAEVARKAASLPIAAVPLLLSMPPAPPSEWAGRIERAFPGPQATSLRNVALVYALLLDGQFAPAAMVLEKLYRQSGPAPDDGVRLELAWAYLESGRAKDAAPLLQSNPIPPMSGPGALLSFYFPGIYYLRGLAAARPGEARANYRLFLQLSGPDGFVWGEEKKARAALAAQPDDEPGHPKN